MLQQEIPVLVVCDVALWEFPQCLDQRRCKERQQGQARVGVALLVEVPAQRLELRDIDFLDIGKMRDLELR